MRHDSPKEPNPAGQAGPPILLRELAARLDAQHEDERARLARDIHEQLGSLLVATKLEIDWLTDRLAERSELQVKARQIGQRLDAAVEQVGRITTELRPSILDHQGLWAALEWRAEETLESRRLRGDVKLHVCHGVELPTGTVGERWSTAVFRIFQQLIAEIVHQKGVTTLRVRLYVDGPPQPVLHLEVGGDAAADADGDDVADTLVAARERAHRFGGTLKRVGSAGASLLLTMPLPDASDSAMPVEGAR
ncbi:sensor histidine kinase [Piscinibacter sakaiensis]|uniref:sensor histidine kinase n=1 Tax=Piscinibacter sakaiensis TaxID=1547922 RepID=UPI003AAE77A8